MFVYHIRPDGFVILKRARHFFKSACGHLELFANQYKHKKNYYIHSNEADSQDKKIHWTVILPILY